MTVDSAPDPTGVLSQLANLRQHQRSGRRSPHKPLLVLVALGRLHATGTSSLPWSVAEQQLGALIAEYGPASTTSRAQSAAYPFTRLRTDGIWLIDHDVPMDNVGPLAATAATGRFTPDLEDRLRRDPQMLRSAARAIVEAHFPDTLAEDILTAAGLEPDHVLHASDLLPAVSPGPGAVRRTRDSSWPRAVLQAWDRQCAFCGFDGQLLGTTIGVDAAHVRWFAMDGPDDLDNGLALCTLHHKLFDYGVIGLDTNLRVCVSDSYTARTATGRSVYDLHGRPLKPRPGTKPPADQHIDWHHTQVFKGAPLAA